MKEQIQIRQAERAAAKEIEPAIRSALDLDFYKLSMAQYAAEYYPNTQVTYEFKNRKEKIRLAEVIPLEELEAQIEAVRQLEFENDEIEYLGSLTNERGRLFSDKFLSGLRNIDLPRPKIGICDGQYEISVSGDWQTAILWETYILAIVNELYNRKLVEQMGGELDEIYREGDRRLSEKIERLKEHPEIEFIEFGTRRRFSQPWQEYVVGRLVTEIPENLVGSSNVYLAQKYGLRPIGTMAHEVFMVVSGVCRQDYWEGLDEAESEEEAVLNSHQRVLDEWYEMYGQPLAIALTDTFGSEFFFSDMREDQARLWRGLRQDSGDPFEFGRKAKEFYERMGIDPKSKTIVFSDGLNLETMIRLQGEFGGVFGGLPFGWGTNLTNDLGIEALSIVMKAMEADGQPLVKLSDNLKKAMGQTDQIEFYRRVFRHTNNYSQDCTY